MGMGLMEQLGVFSWTPIFRLGLITSSSTNRIGYSIVDSISNLWNRPSYTEEQIRQWEVLFEDGSISVIAKKFKETEEVQYLCRFSNFDRSSTYEITPRPNFISNALSINEIRRRCDLIEGFELSNNEFCPVFKREVHLHDYEEEVCKNPTAEGSMGGEMGLMEQLGVFSWTPIFRLGLIDSSSTNRIGYSIVDSISNLWNRPSYTEEQIRQWEVLFEDGSISVIAKKFKETEEVQYLCRFSNFDRSSTYEITPRPNFISNALSINEIRRRCDLIEGFELKNNEFCPVFKREVHLNDYEEEVCRYPTSKGSLEGEVACIANYRTPILSFKLRFITPWPLRDTFDESSDFPLLEGVTKVEDAKRICSLNQMWQVEMKCGSPKFTHKMPPHWFTDPGENVIKLWKDPLDERIVACVKSNKGAFHFVGARNNLEKLSHRLRVNPPIHEWGLDERELMSLVKLVKHASLYAAPDGAPSTILLFTRNEHPTFLVSDNCLSATTNKDREPEDHALTLTWSAGVVSGSITTHEKRMKIFKKYTTSKIEQDHLPLMFRNPLSLSAFEAITSTIHKFYYHSNKGLSVSLLSPSVITAYNPCISYQLALHECLGFPNGEGALYQKYHRILKRRAENLQYESKEMVQLFRYLQAYQIPLQDNDSLKLAIASCIPGGAFTYEDVEVSDSKAEFQLGYTPPNAAKLDMTSTLLTKKIVITVTDWVDILRNIFKAFKSGLMHKSEQDVIRSLTQTEREELGNQLLGLDSYFDMLYPLMKKCFRSNATITLEIAKAVMHNKIFFNPMKVTVCPPGYMGRVVHMGENFFVASLWTGETSVKVAAEYQSVRKKGGTQ